MPQPPQSSRKPASRWRASAYKVFYALPKVVRRRLVRIVAPTYTVGAVMMVYSPDRTQILLLRQPPGFGWGLPAGLLDRGERPEQAAIRELREETGIDLGLDAISPAAPSAVIHTRGRWVDTVFVTEVEPDSVELVIDGAEVWEAKWWPVTALPPITVAASRLLAHYGLGPYADYPEAARVD